MRFKELSYANENDPRLKRWFIRSMEGLAGRNRYARLYDTWRHSVVGTSARVFGDMLDLIDVRLAVQGAWPPATVALCLTNDLVWWAPFALYLRDAWPAYRRPLAATREKCVPSAGNRGE